MRRPPLENLYLNPNNIIISTVNRFNGLLDLTDIHTDSSDGHIAHVHEGDYHSLTRTDNKGSDDDLDLWLDLREEKKEDWERPFRKAASDATINEI